MPMSLLAQPGFREAFDALARRHAPELVRYAHNRAGNLDDARDIVQGALLKAWGAWQEGSRPDQPRAWLYRIVHNELVNHTRSQNVRSRRFAPTATNPDELLGIETRETIEAVRKLPPPFGEVIALHYLQGLSIVETARVLGVPEGTAKSQLARGLDQLREKLGQQRRPT